ncbi:MAG: SIMPL domain-containing protein [Thermoanaerobaculia bacterium]
MRGQSRATFGLAVVAFVLAGGSSRAADPAAPRHDSSRVRTISVIGEGDATGTPDVARAGLGVEVRSSRAGVAVAEANTHMTAVVSALKKAGVAAKDIRTTDFSVDFERPPEPSPEAGQYRVRNVVEVTIRDRDRAGVVLDAALSSGANDVFGISFSIEDPSPLREKAREAAVADARSRAEGLARAGGVGLGPLLSLSEEGSSSPRPVAIRAMAMSAGPPIESGDLTVSAQVRAVYEIAPAATR